MREGLTECCRRTAVRVERSGRCCRQVVQVVQEASANSAEREVTAGEA